LSQVITVEIAGQKYPIRSGFDPAYVGQLAAYVDKKMRAAASAAPSSDMLGLAILVALNIADEYFQVSHQQSSANGEFNERALRLEQLVDDVLAQVTAQ
jgi:cell division protein ZapA